MMGLKKTLLARLKKTVGRVGWGGVGEGGLGGGLGAEGWEGWRAFHAAQACFKASVKPHSCEHSACRWVGGRGTAALPNPPPPLSGLASLLQSISIFLKPLIRAWCLQVGEGRPPSPLCQAVQSCFNPHEPFSDPSCQHCVCKCGNCCLGRGFNSYESL